MHNPEPPTPPPDAPNGGQPGSPNDDPFALPEGGADPFAGAGGDDPFAASAGDEPSMLDIDAVPDAVPAGAAAPPPAGDDEDADEMVALSVGHSAPQAYDDKPIDDEMVQRIRALDQRVGRLLGELDGAIAADRRIQLGSALRSETLADTLRDDAADVAATRLRAAELDELVDDLRGFRRVYDDRVFKFGIVGFQSSGKSYLISALFDQLNFLPSLDEATTSVVTRIRYPFEHESADVVTVHFNDDAGRADFVKFLTRVNATERVSDPIRFVDRKGEAKIEVSFDQKDFFLKCENPGRDLARYRLIDEVHILRASPFLTDSTEIIDLPGLGGPYALLDETTMRYLDEVDAVLFIAPVSQNWVAKDTEIFAQLASRPNVLKKVFFVLAKLDNPGSDLEKSVGTFHNLLSEFVSDSVPADRIHYASAWMALMDRLRNVAQTSMLETVARSFESQDATSFFKVHNTDLRRRLTPTFTPRDGGIRPLRNGLYRFFSTHKRLLQLNELLVGMRERVGDFARKLRSTRDAVRRRVGNVAEGADREVQRLARRQNELLESVRYSMADRLEAAAAGATNGDPARGPVFAPFSLEVLGDMISRSVDRRIADLGVDGEPERVKARREVAYALAPLVAHDVATQINDQAAPRLTARSQPLVRDRLDPFAREFPDPVREPLEARLSEWPRLVHASLGALVAPATLSALRPPVGAAEEMDPFRAVYTETGAEALREALDRLELESPTAVVAAWSTLRNALHRALTIDGGAYYRANPDAPRPFVESPESLLADLGRADEEFKRIVAELMQADDEVAETLTMV
jgi:hypothetical protein